MVDLVEHAKYMGSGLVLDVYYLGDQSSSYCLQYIIPVRKQWHENYIGNANCMFTSHDPDYLDDYVWTRMGFARRRCLTFKIDGIYVRWVSLSGKEVMKPYLYTSDIDQCCIYLDNHLYPEKL